MSKPRLNTIVISDDAQSVIGLLKWAIENNIRFDSVSIGSCTVTLAKLVPGVTPDDKRKGPTREDIYERFGGALTVPARATGAPIEMDRGELEPAI